MGVILLCGICIVAAKRKADDTSHNERCAQHGLERMEFEILYIDSDLQNRLQKLVASGRSSDADFVSNARSYVVEEIAVTLRGTRFWSDFDPYVSSGVGGVTANELAVLLMLANRGKLPQCATIMVSGFGRHIYEGLRDPGDEQARLLAEKWIEFLEVAQKALYEHGVPGGWFFDARNKIVLWSGEFGTNGRGERPLLDVKCEIIAGAPYTTETIPEPYYKCGFDL